jgi:fructose/tagatose bisphosphate aldolase
MRFNNVIIVHNAEHIDAALTVAQEMSVVVKMQTPASAIDYMGAPFIKEMLEQASKSHPAAEFTFICDAGEDPAHVQEAFQAGFQHVRFTGNEIVREKLDSIAEHYQGNLCANEDETLEVLDLCFVENAKEACKRWYMEAELAAA